MSPRDDTLSHTHHHEISSRDEISSHTYYERQRRQRVAEAFANHCKLRDAHEQLARHHAQAAEALCEDG